MTLQEYDLDIHYHPGKENIVADALSWTTDVNMVTTTQPDHKFKDCIVQGYSSDPYWHKILQLQPSDRMRIGVHLVNGLLVKDNCIIIPNDPDLQHDIVFDLHDSPVAAHLGCDKTLELVQRHYY